MTTTAASRTDQRITRRTTLDDVFDRPGSVRSLSILRIALGPIVIAHLWPYLSSTWHGVTYDDHFFVAWWSVAPQPPGWVQVLLVWTGAVAAVGLTLGWRTRLVAAVTWLCVAGNLFLSQHHYHQNRAFLLLLLGGVTLGESGRVLSLDARRRRRRAGDDAGGGQGDGDRATVWPLYLLRALVSSVYFASGFSKLIDPDWVGGLVLWDRVVRYQDHVRHSILPGPVADAVLDVLTTRWFHAVLSPTAVATELFIAIGLWFGPTRLAAVWAALAFHLSIEVSASVQVFSLAGIVALVIWATPVTRDRTVVVGPGGATWIRRLDWLARFDVHDRTDAELQVVDRDGSVHTGRDARWLLTSRLPLLFPFVAPLRWWWR